MCSSAVRGCGPFAAWAQAAGRTKTEASGLDKSSFFTSTMVCGCPLLPVVIQRIINPNFVSTHTLDFPSGMAVASRTLTGMPFSVAEPTCVERCLARSAFNSAEAAKGSPQSPENVATPQGAEMLLRSQVKLVLAFKS